MTDDYEHCGIFLSHFMLTRISYANLKLRMCANVIFYTINALKWSPKKLLI